MDPIYIFYSPVRVLEGNFSNDSNYMIYFNIFQNYIL